jgi:hypothetical protein
VVGLLAKLPEYIYSTDQEGLFVNLYSPSTMNWRHGDKDVTVTQATGFPGTDDVTMTVGTDVPRDMCVRIRVPAWAARDMTINVNGEPAIIGKPGTYAAIQRTWANKDVISFSLPMKFTTVQYEGHDQAADNVDRHALLYGPILMALNDENGRIKVEPAALPGLLSPVEGHPLQFDVAGTSYRFRPYWQVQSGFTCFPMVQP